MSALRRPRARRRVPRTAVRARPLQNRQVPAPRRRVARSLVSRVAFRACPLSTSSLPPSAAARHTSMSVLGCPCRCKRLVVSQFPTFAARCISGSDNRRPFASSSTISRIAGLTARSRAKSAVSNKHERIFASTTWLGRPGIASPASACVTVACAARSAAFLRARFAAHVADLGGIVVRGGGWMPCHA